MTAFSAYPRCVVEIYPWEGGRYEIQGGDILACKVSKPINGAPGGFTLTLAPNGIGSTNARAPDWTRVITPMSFILIGMQRFQYSQIVMIGVVKSVITQQDWVSNNGQVTRVISVTGQDFSQFFDSFNWSILGFLGVTGASALGQGLTGNPNSGIPATFGQGLLGGSSAAESNPAVVGQNWYANIMAGPKGILAKTNMAYQGGRVTFTESMSTVFEKYPDIFIPFYDNFLSSEGNWTQKFKAIFPWPFYEFFVITAPIGYYGKGVTTTKTTPASTDGSGSDFGITAPKTVTTTSGPFLGRPFTMQGLPAAEPAGPVLVARINPLPRLTAKSQGAGLPFTLTGIDADRWNKLELTQLDNHGFFSSTLGFSLDGVRNAYTLNPIAMRALFGDTNSGTNIFFYSFSGAIDVASVHRYGYRPEVTSTEWFADPTGSAGANKELDIPQSVATLLCQVISQYQPSPLMAAGSVSFSLRPDILPGTRFTYSPFRGQEPWTFYVDAVEHDFNFGGTSSTTLTISRGLPNSVYTDFSKSGIFYACLTGTAERQEGEYAILTATPNDVGLTIFGGQPEQIAALAGSIAGAFSNPQTQ